MEMFALDWSQLWPFIAVGLAAQLVDGALGMAFGVIASTLMVSIMGVPTARASAAVHLVEVSDDVLGLAAREAAQWLSRHGIAADVHEWPAKGRRVSAALLHAAAELSAHYIVMGAYGHSRLRETVLGGVTRELIASANVPLLLAH